MGENNRFLNDFDARMANWMARHAILFLRISLGIVFLWFGGLKLVPGLSPAEGLAGKTIVALTGGLMSAPTAVAILAVWETLIGLGLLTGKWLRATLALLWLQMLGTVTPLLLFPDECWQVFGLVPTMEGQYILKNLVLVSAGIAIGATVRGGHLVEELRDQ